MVTLTTEGNSLKFTFQDSQHYLQGNGEIIAPKGSLALITDESDMANFVKADSNDIFVSATYDELGMSKSDILSWFAANAGSSSGGGGGGGLTPQEAQEMIDSSISGKADTSAVTEALASKVDTSVFNSFTFDTYNTFQTKADVSALTQTNTNLNELGNLVNEKLATSTFTAYTSTTESAIASKASQADLDALEDVVDGKADTTAMTEALASKLNISDFNTYSGNVDSVLATKANLSDIPDVSSYINSTDYDSVNHLIKFFHNETLIDSIDAADFIKDGMVSNVEISGGNLVISFNTDAGKEAISIPLTDIFNPNNYYDKTATDALLANKVDVSAYTAYTSATDSAIASKASNADLQSVSGVVDGKLATSDFNTYTSATDSAIASKADASALTDYVNNTTFETYTAATDSAIASKADASALTDYVETTAMTTALADKLDISDFNTYSGTIDTAIASKADASALTDYVETTAMTQELVSKLDVSTFNSYSGSVDTALQGKQGTLTAGNNIDITNNVISVTGSTQVIVDDELSSSSTNPVVNSAITTAINGKLSISDFNTYSASVDTAIASKADASELTNYVDNTTFEAYSGDVDTALQSKADSSDLANKVDVSVFNTYSASVDTALQSKADASALTNKVDVSAYTAYTSATDTAIADKSDSTAVTAALADKLDVSAFNTYSGTIDTALQGKADASDLAAKADSTAVTQALESKVDVSAFNTYSGDVDTALQGKANTSDLANKVDTSVYTAYTSSTQTTLNGKQNALTAGTNISITNDVISVTGITSQSVVELTQAQYDALATKEPNTFYVITDASGGVTIDPTLDSGSTNPVANSAITNAIDAVSAATASNTTALGGYKLWKGTQAQYDAIVTKDESTIYFIVNNS